MTEENAQETVPASEESVSTSMEKEQAQESPMVPLAALQAERHKRQEEQKARMELEERARLYEENLRKLQATQKQPALDENEWVSRGEVKKSTEMTKQEILEQVYCDSNPEKVAEIESYLKPIIERKPWLVDSLVNAPNRYARAYEIVSDYKHMVAREKEKVQDAKKIVENSNKPGSPAAVPGSPAPASKANYLLSIRGTKEFADYRKQVMGKR